MSALNLVEFKNKKAVFDKAINYLKSNQRNDGGWGEDGKSYYKNFENLSKKSTPSQTSWAIMGLLAAGEINSPEVEKGIKYLTNKDTKFQEWDRYNSKGERIGKCGDAKKGEGKPKCLPKSKAQSLGKKGRKTAASRKRREDPNKNRKGKAKNVRTK